MKNQSRLLKIFASLLKFAEKLPGPLQKPIQSELKPVCELFLEQRPPVFLIAGPCSQNVRAWLGKFGSTSHAEESFAPGIESHTSPNDASILTLEADYSSAKTHSPDLILIGADSDNIIEDIKKSLPSHMAAPVFVLLPDESLTPINRTSKSEPVSTDAPQSVIRLSDPLLEEQICASLPRQAQLQFARFTGAKRAQAYIASSLLKSFCAVSGVVGLQPIPLADLPVLTSIQSLMVALIIHTSGRPLRMRLAAEFLASIGANLGLGFAFREAARVLVRVVPFWGNAVSGFVAGAGTYAIGRAAIAYFIDDSPIQETRRLFESIASANRKPKLNALD